MSHKVNLVRVLTAATGNSTPITLGTAYSQLFMTPAEAGAMNGRVYTYLIVDGNDWEMGKGAYTSSGTTLARTTVLASRISGTLGTSRISLSGTAQVRFIESAEDMDGIRGTRAVTGTSDVIANSDQGYAVTYSNAASIAVTLAQASASNLFLDGWATTVQNLGAGAVTITPATSTINGGSTLVLAQNMGAFIWSDGTNYHAAFMPVTKPLLAGNNLSDLASAPTALTNLGGTTVGKALFTATDEAAARTAIGANGAVVPPQGRLTLATGTPVMATTQSGKTTLYYTPYVGNMIPLYDGTNMVPTVFSELSIATTDTSKNPAAIGASKVNDWFVWNDSGTLRLSHGPDWTSDTARSTGTALVMVNGILLNNASITNGPAASRGTYVGTTRSNGSSQLDFIIGGSSSGGTAAFLNVWNMYNRRAAKPFVQDSTTGWTYTTAAWRAADASNTYRISFVVGLVEDGVEAKYASMNFSTSASVQTGISIALDSTNAIATGATSFTSYYSGNANQQIGGVATYSGYPGLGFHYLQAIEYGGTNGTFDGVAGITSSGLSATIWY